MELLIQRQRLPRAPKARELNSSAEARALSAHRLRPPGGFRKAIGTRPGRPDPVKFCDCDKQRRGGRPCSVVQSGLLRLAICWFSLALLVSFGFFVGQVRGQAFKEYEVKATFLYHLAQFVEWPAEAFPAAETPLVIGVLGQDPFGKTLDEIIQNELVKNRKLVVQRYRQAGEIGICHVLFISRSEEERLDQILSRFKGRSTLTVGDSEGFARRGGAVRFFTEKNKVRLRINLDTAKAANLTISSKLLRASELVGSGGAGR